MSHDTSMTTARLYENSMIKPAVMHLLSGGLDSTVLLYDLIAQDHKVHCVLFDYKQKHVQELTFAKLHCRRLNVLFTTIDVPQLRGSELTDGSGTVVVPNRNAILLSLAVNIGIAAKAEIITFGANKDDAEMFPDCRSEFITAFNDMMDAAKLSIVVAAPYLNCSKAWIARLGSDLKVKPNETWSCYRGGKEPCGECLACQKRKEAFA